jgi:hypothetical protein
MTSYISEIVFITEHYHYLKTPLLQIEKRMFRRKKLERQARKAIMKFSKHDVHSLTNYLAEDQNEMTTWIHLAVLECNKIKKQESPSIKPTKY